MSDDPDTHSYNQQQTHEADHLIRQLNECLSGLQQPIQDALGPDYPLRDLAISKIDEAQTALLKIESVTQWLRANNFTR